MNFIKIFIIAGLVMATGICASAQRVISADSIAVPAREPSSGGKIHSPRKAVIYSAVLPGLGQIYNKKIWKLPLVYGGFAALIYFIDYNNDFYVLYKKAYSDIIDDDDTTNAFKDLPRVQERGWDWNNPAHVKQLTTLLLNAKRSARRYRDLCIIGTAAFYALTMIDASVDAHLFGFDIGDDLTFNWTPQQTFAMNQPVWGIQCTIKF